MLKNLITFLALFCALTLCSEISKINSNNFCKLAKRSRMHQEKCAQHFSMWARRLCPKRNRMPVIHKLREENKIYSIHKSNERQNALHESAVERKHLQIKKQHAKLYFKSKQTTSEQCVYPRKKLLSKRSNQSCPLFENQLSMSQKQPVRLWHSKELLFYGQKSMRHVLKIVWKRRKQKKNFINSDSGLLRLANMCATYDAILYVIAWVFIQLMLNF